LITISCSEFYGSGQRTNSGSRFLLSHKSDMVTKALARQSGNRLASMDMQSAVVACSGHPSGSTRGMTLVELAWMASTIVRVFDATVRPRRSLKSQLAITSYTAKLFGDR